jgi:hypothetical protein
MTLRLLLAFALLASLFVLAGCAAMAVQPWDRDVLAQKKMQYVPDPMDQFYDQHIQFSKEGSMGGQGVGGGGCGCN